MVASADIAILIPAYGQAEFTENAIRCALATEAGEILLSDDCSDLPMKLFQEKYTDKRLRFFKQDQNIGLWQNHLFLLQKSTKSWVKFLQTDDSFTEQAFNQLVYLADETVSIVTMEPAYKHLDSGKIMYPSKVANDECYTSSNALALFSSFGNYPGRPSYCLYNKKLMNLDTAFWSNEVSADLTQNVWLASKGRVVRTKNKGLTCGIHTAQDGKNQSSSLILSRLRNSYQLLSKQLDSKEVRLVRSYFLTEFALLSKLALSSVFKNTEVSVLHLVSTTKQIAYALANPKIISGATAYTKYKLGK